MTDRQTKKQYGDTTGIFTQFAQCPHLFPDANPLLSGLFQSRCPRPQATTEASARVIPTLRLSQLQSRPITPPARPGYVSRVKQGGALKPRLDAWRAITRRVCQRRCWFKQIRRLSSPAGFPERAEAAARSWESQFAALLPDILLLGRCCSESGAGAESSGRFWWA